ncbi:MAG: AraC family transcriptional regulator [Lentisphaerales bacterium]|nr:AraC family transcriptional regulator [Lentisphaerales bacterium]
MNRYKFINDLKLKIYAFEKVKVGTWWNYPKHSSPFARIFVILEGEQQVRFDGKTYHQTAGNIYLVPPFTAVDYSCKDYCLQHYIIFSTELAGYGSAFQHGNVKCEFPLNEVMKTAVNQLVTSAPQYGLKSYNPAGKEYNKSIAHRPLTEVAPLIHWQASAVTRLLLTPFLESLSFSESHERFIQVIKYMETHLSEQISLKDLAAQVALAPTYFSDIFVENFGVRPMKYIHQLRIEKAQLLLSTSPYNVSEISQKCGFKSSAYFCRSFKESTGLTPKQYRQNGF